MDADRSPAILHAAQTALKKDHRLVCWNSTEGIADVLQIACAQHRRVRFLRWSAVPHFLMLISCDQLTVTVTLQGRGDSVNASARADRKKSP